MSAPESRAITAVDLSAVQVGPGHRALRNGWAGPVVVSFIKTQGTPTSWKWSLTSGYRFARPIEPAGSARTYSAALEQVIRAVSVHGILGPDDAPVVITQDSVDAARGAAADRPSKAHEDAVDKLMDVVDAYYDPNGGKTGEDLWEDLITLGWMPPRGAW